MHNLTKFYEIKPFEGKCKKSGRNAAMAGSKEWGWWNKKACALGGLKLKCIEKHGARLFMETGGAA